MHPSVYMVVHLSIHPPTYPPTYLLHKGRLRHGVLKDVGDVFFYAHLLPQGRISGLVAHRALVRTGVQPLGFGGSGWVMGMEGAAADSHTMGMTTTSYMAKAAQGRQPAHGQHHLGVLAQGRAAAAAGHGVRGRARTR